MARYSSGLRSRPASLLELTSALVAAYVSQNAVASKDMPTAIRLIHAALLAAQSGTASGEALVLPSESEIAASIRYDRIVSFIDGKAYKSLKRHLTAFGTTPDQYRSRYGLPRDYPLVSPGYARVRSRIAKQTYHGRKVA